MEGESEYCDEADSGDEGERGGGTVATCVISRVGDSEGTDEHWSAGSLFDLPEREALE